MAQPGRAYDTLYGKRAGVPLPGLKPSRVHLTGVCTTCVREDKSSCNQVPALPHGPASEAAMYSMFPVNFASDPVYTVSGARDHYRQQTRAGGFNLERAPEYPNMFSELPHYPPSTYRYEPWLSLCTEAMHLMVWHSHITTASVSVRCPSSSQPAFGSSSERTCLLFLAGSRTLTKSQDLWTGRFTSLQRCLRTSVCAA